MSSKAQQTVLKLNDQTKKGQINWTEWEVSIYSVETNERRKGKAYYSNVNGRGLRIYQYEAKHYYEEDVYDWVIHTRLEMVDNKGNTEWTFPEVRGIDDLYNSIQYKVSGAENFLDNFLNED